MLQNHGDDVAQAAAVERRVYRRKSFDAVGKREAAAREGGVLNAVPCPVRGDGLVAGGGQSPPNKLLKQGGKTRRDLLAHARRAR